MTAKIAKQPHAAPRSRVVSVRLPADVFERLDSYARMMARSRGRSELIVQAIEDYLSWRIPQQAEVLEGIAAAERGELVDHDQIVIRVDRVRSARRSRITSASVPVAIERKKAVTRLS